MVSVRAPSLCRLQAKGLENRRLAALAWTLQPGAQNSFLIQVQAAAEFAGRSLQRHRLGVRASVAVAFGVRVFATGRLPRNDSLGARNGNRSDDRDQIADKLDAADVIRPARREVV